APERLQARSDARSDIYSLGMTLYELLTLRPGFEQAERSLLLRRVLHDEPPRPRKLNPAVPRDLETIVLKAMAKDPARRYQAAGASGDALRRFPAAGPIRARPPSLAYQVRKLAWRHKAMVAAAAGVLVASLGGTVATSVFALREAEQRRRADAHA